MRERRTGEEVEHVHNGLRAGQMVRVREKKKKFLRNLQYRSHVG